MQSMGNVIQSLADKATIFAAGDYCDDEGYLVCGKCHTRKQFDVNWPVGGNKINQRVSIPCKCRIAEIRAQEDADERRRFNHRMKELRKDGITDPKYLEFTFSEDDRRNPKISDVCMEYVRSWEEMRAKNTGILFYGNIGTGKSFLACCIANALLEKLIPVSVTNFPRILNCLQGAYNDKQVIINKMQKYDLLVLDDLGVERETSYAAEQIYHVIDTRERAGKPLIVTTNMTVEELENVTDIQYKRIYDRVLRLCPIQLRMAGKSRRAEEAALMREEARNMLVQKNRGNK